MTHLKKKSENSGDKLRKWHRKRKCEDGIQNNGICYGNGTKQKRNVERIVQKG